MERKKEGTGREWKLSLFTIMVSCAAVYSNINAITHFSHIISFYY